MVIKGFKFDGPCISRDGSEDIIEWDFEGIDVGVDADGGGVYYTSIPIEVLKEIVRQHKEAFGD